MMWKDWTSFPSLKRGASKSKNARKYYFLPIWKWVCVCVWETTANATTQKSIFNAMGPWGGLLRDPTNCLPLKQQKAISHASCSKWKPEISVWNVMALPKSCQRAARGLTPLQLPHHNIPKKWTNLWTHPCSSPRSAEVKKKRKKKLCGLCFLCRYLLRLTYARMGKKVPERHKYNSDRLYLFLLTNQKWWFIQPGW